jgi:two-component system, OmpR family, phosphate regulon sensor histidine kinase PhoR
MKKNHSHFYLILAFIVAQFAWMGLLGLWIYWYISNYIIFMQVGDKLSPQIVIDGPKVGVFVFGIILIVLIAVAIFFFFRNMTVQRKLNGLYDNFIANITHELKSPLSSIQLYLETLSVKSVKPEKQKEFLDIMMRDANRLKKLINSILEISQLEQKRVAHDYRVFDADKILQELIADSTENFRLPGHSVKYDGHASCKCLLDKEAMQIVFDNLTDNAIKYSVDQVDIEVKSFSNSKYLFVEFSDHGIGINAKDQKKVFNKFHRVDNKNIPSVKGSGLGLYWVKEIIKFHGGKIWITSDGLNTGTCFKMEIPVYRSSRLFYLNSSVRRVAKKERIMEKVDGE